MVQGMLERLADFLEEDAEATLSNLISLIEPLFVVFLVIMMSAIAICLSLPLFQFSEAFPGWP